MEEQRVVGVHLNLDSWWIHGAGYPHWSSDIGVLLYGPPFVDRHVGLVILNDFETTGPRRTRSIHGTGRLTVIMPSPMFACLMDPPDPFDSNHPQPAWCWSATRGDLHGPTGPTSLWNPMGSVGSSGGTLDPFRRPTKKVFFPPPDTTHGTAIGLPIRPGVVDWGVCLGRQSYGSPVECCSLRFHVPRRVQCMW